MTDLFSYLLPYPAMSLFCDSKLQSLTNLPSKLTVTALLVDSGKSSLVIKQREHQFNPTFSWMSPRPSYGSTATVISTDMGKKKSKFDANTLLLELNWEISSTDSIYLASKFPNLHCCISAYQFQYFNWCEICVIASFLCAAWVIIRALLVRRFYNRVYERFPPHLLWS